MVLPSRFLMASRFRFPTAVGIVGSGSGSSDAPSLTKRCAGRRGHQRPVLAVIAMLSAKSGCACHSTEGSAAEMLAIALLLTLAWKRARG